MLVTRKKAIAAIAAGAFAFSYCPSASPLLLAQEQEESVADDVAEEEQNTEERDTVVEVNNSNIVRHIVIDGVESIRAQDIRKLVKSTKNGEQYSKESVKADLANIIGSGAVQDARARTIMSNGELYVVFEIQEISDVTEVVITGNTLIPSDEIKSQLLTQSNRAFIKENVDKDVATIKDLYSKKGYIAIVGGVNNTKGKVTFRVMEAKVEDIRFSGNKRTKEWLLEKVSGYSIKKGDYLTSSAIESLYTNLMSLGIFEAVSIDAGAGSADDLVVLNVEIKEARTGQWNLGGAYSTQYKLQAVGGVSDNNVKGEGKRISFDFGLGKKRNTFSFSYVDPYYKKTDTTVFFDLYRSFKDIDDHIRYDETRTGGTIGMIKPISKDKRTKFFADFDIDFIKVKDTDGNKLQNLKSNTLTLGIMRDERDDATDPHKGSYLRAGVTHSSKIFGSDATFTKLFAEARHYTQIAARDVLAARLSLNYSPDHIPYVEQFTVGGADSVRGIDEDAQHGNKSVIASLEFRHTFNKNIQGVVFADAGKAWSDAVNNALKVAYGVGIRVKTAMGILRLDAAKANGESVKYMFGIGHTF